MGTEANIKRMNAILDALRPGTSISYIKIKPEPVSPETEERLQKIFGDKLTIED